MPILCKGRRKPAPFPRKMGNSAEIANFAAGFAAKFCFGQKKYGFFKLF
jgi:hypothetical protein